MQTGHHVREVVIRVRGAAPAREEAFQGDGTLEIASDKHINQGKLVNNNEHRHWILPRCLVVHCPTCRPRVLTMPLCRAFRMGNMGAHPDIKRTVQKPYEATVRRSALDNCPCTVWYRHTHGNSAQ
jgi:hypothetical protein